MVVGSRVKRGTQQREATRYRRPNIKRHPQAVVAPRQINASRRFRRSAAMVMILLGCGRRKRADPDFAAHWAP